MFKKPCISANIDNVDNQNFYEDKKPWKVLHAYIYLHISKHGW